MSHMPMTTPSTAFLSIRLTLDDRANYARVHQHLQSATGAKLSAADIMRMGLRALSEQHNIKGIK